MRTIFQSDNYSPRETNMEYQEWCEMYNMEDTEELYYSYLREQANADYEWILQELGDIQVPNKIIVTGKLQRWNGVSYGGEPCIKGEDYRCTQYADDVLTWISNRRYEDFELYIENGNLKAKCIHHDGTDYVTFRCLKEGKEIETFFNRKLTPRRISTYTTSLARFIYK